MTPPTPDREGTTSLYFGNPDNTPGWTQASCSGHRFCVPGSRLRAADRHWASQNPWGIPDGALAPRAPGYRRGPELPEGVAALHHKDGWTALSFWDRSGDSRGNSSSTFLFDEVLDFAQALARAREQFPQLFDRFPFEVVPL